MVWVVCAGGGFRTRFKQSVYRNRFWASNEGAAKVMTGNLTFVVNQSTRQRLSLRQPVRRYTCLLKITSPIIASTLFSVPARPLCVAARVPFRAARRGVPTQRARRIFVFI